MAKEYYNIEISDYEVSEKDKNDKKYLITSTDSLITNLVFEREDSYKRRKMRRMRDMYEGYRDDLEFAYLEDNFGISNPIDLKFIPVVRNRIDVLIGILSTSAFDFKITVLDRDTIDLMKQEKAMKMLSNIYQTIIQDAERFKKQYYTYIQKPEEGEKPYMPPVLRNMVEEAKDKVEKEWRSVFVDAANNLIKYYLNDVDFDMHQKRRTIFEDLLVVGECTYRVKNKRFGKTPELEVLLPENFFHDLPRDKKLVKESMKAVYVRYLTKKEILKDYGHLMDKDDRETLFNMTTIKYSASLRHPSEIERRTRIDRERQYNDEWRYLDDTDVMKVYECEWIGLNPYDVNTDTSKANLPVEGPDTPDKQEWRMDLYQSVRIGENIYLEMGRSQFAKRSKKDPMKTTLNFNGIRFSDRNGEPYSLVWKCKDLQDMHDILYFHRDNLVANSGVDGSRVNVGALPDFLGTDMTERLQKIFAYRKQGTELYDGTKDGAINFQHYGDFKGGVDGNAINAINAILAQIDDEITKITGVTKPMLGLIEQREAVSNVKQGMIQSSLVVRNLFDHNDVVTRHILMDLISSTQKAFEDELEPLYGAYPAKKGQEMFALMPEQFCFTDYNIHVTSTSDEFSKIQIIRASVSEFIQAKLLSPHVMIRVMTMDSLHDIYDLLEAEFEEKERQNNELKQAEQEIDQLKQQNSEMQSELKKLKDSEQQLEQAKLQLEQWKANKDYDIKNRTTENTREYNEGRLELQRETVELEAKQLEMGSGREREVKNI